jgi:hypothetical protein
MKKSPQLQKLEEVLKSTKFSASGFMGNDQRNLWEIIDEDAAAVSKAGKTMEQVASRMQELTDAGADGLGDWIAIGQNLLVMVDDNRGVIPCPWPHHVRCLKRITTVQNTCTNRKLRWSELNVHLIRAHGFFEGKGSPFRLEPLILIQTIFTTH